MRKFAATLMFCLLCLAACGAYDFKTYCNPEQPSCYPELDLATENSTALLNDTIPIRHITHTEFLHAVNNPRLYPGVGFIHAGVVPHHLVASTLISGFFTLATEFAQKYDLVIVFAPNHFGDVADVVLSCRHWDIGSGLRTHRGFVEDMMAAQGIDAAISHHRMEEDHAASVLMPFIYHYLPDTIVVPMLLNRSLGFDATLRLFAWMMEWLDAADYTVLLLASIDFSHFLTTPEALARDAVTAEVVAARDFKRIHLKSDFYLDSPASLIIFLKYLDALGLEMQIIDHTDASEFLGGGIEETTTYKIIVGS